MDIWGKPITVGMLTATPGQQRDAWNAWTDLPHSHRSRIDLAQCIENSGLGDGTCQDMPDYMGIADEMIDRARRAGIIEYRSGSWRLAAGQRATDRATE